VYFRDGCEWPEGHQPDRARRVRLGIGVDGDWRERIGIDGYIERFDPTTRKPLGLTLAAQSKVSSALCKNSSPTFDYWCDRSRVLAGGEHARGSSLHGTHAGSSE